MTIYTVYSEDRHEILIIYIRPVHHIFNPSVISSADLWVGLSKNSGASPAYRPPISRQLYALVRPQPLLDGTPQVVLPSRRLLDRVPKNRLAEAALAAGQHARRLLRHGRVYGLGVVVAQLAAEGVVLLLRHEYSELLAVSQIDSLLQLVPDLAVVLLADLPVLLFPPLLLLEARSVMFLHRVLPNDRHVADEVVAGCLSKRVRLLTNMRRLSMLMPLYWIIKFIAPRNGLHKALKCTPNIQTHRTMSHNIAEISKNRQVIYSAGC